MLTVESVTTRYGPVRALESVHLQVKEGDLVGVVGANGAGKTTLMSTVMGLVKPAAGQVTFLGRPITGLTPEAIAAQGIALVPEGRHIFGTLTVAENLKLGLTTRRGKKSVKDFEPVFDRFPILRELNVFGHGGLWTAADVVKRNREYQRAGWFPWITDPHFDVSIRVDVRCIISERHPTAAAHHLESALLYALRQRLRTVERTDAGSRLPVECAEEREADIQQ